MSSPEQAAGLYDVGVLPSTRRLRAALRANAAFSMVSGLVFAVAGAFIARPLGLGPAWLTPLVGAGLLPFAATVALVAALPAARLRPLGFLILIADIGWVAGTAVLLLVVRLPAAGLAVLTGVGAAVAAIAIWEAAGLGAIREPDRLGDLGVAEASRVFPASASELWPVITDHDLYARLAPNLSRVEVISAPGEPLVRRCVNTAGKGWTETCELWEENRRYAVRIDTSDYPYPLRRMEGLWQVDPDPAGSRVTMRFAYQVQPTVKGGLFAVVYGAAFPVMVDRILRGWTHAARPAAVMAER